MQKSFFIRLAGMFLTLQVLAISCYGSSSINSSSTKNYVNNISENVLTFKVTMQSEYVESITPANGATNIGYRPNIQIQFSGPVTHVNAATIKVYASSAESTLVNVVFIRKSDELYIVRPVVAFNSNTKYTIEVTDKVLSESGLPIKPSTTTFTTMRYHFAYITNYNESTITECSVNAAYGMLSNCRKTGSGFKNAYGVAVDPSFNYVYVANVSGDISICQINKTDGILTNCTTFIDKNIPRAYGLAIDPLGENLYIATFQANSTIAKCSIKQDDGTLGNCTIVSFNSADKQLTAYAISINTYGTSAYISTYLDHTIEDCYINQDNTFDSPCNDYESNTTLTMVSGVAANNGSLTTPTVYAVNTDQIGSGLECSIFVKGDGYGCNSTGGVFTRPGDISLDLYNRHAYITNTVNNTISICEIVHNTNFDGCVKYGGKNLFNAPEMITVY